MFGKRLFCRLNHQLVIEDVSSDLLYLTNYAQKEELLQKHLSALIPRYFYFLQKGELNIDKALVQVRKKGGEEVLVKVNLKKDSKGLTLKFKTVRNKCLNQFIQNELQLAEHIQNVSNIGLVCFNTQGYVILTNKYIAQWYQLPIQACVGSKIEQLLKLSEKEKQLFYSELENLNEESLQKEFTVHFANDEKLYLRWEISKIQSPYGAYFLSMVYNITSEYQAKKELEYQRLLFQKVFELSPLPIFIFNKNYRVEKVNNAFLELLEVDRNIAENLDLNVLIDKRPYYVYTDVLEHNKMSIYEGYYNTTYSKKPIFARLIASPVEIEGETKGLGIILDLTKQKKTEEELIQKQNFYKTMVDMAIAGIGITDLEENLIFVNKAFANMLGYEEEEMINTNLRNYCPPQQLDVFKKQSEIRKSLKNSVYEATLLHKNGQTVSVLLFSSPYVNSENQVVGTLGVLVDISHQKMLLQLYDKLKQDYHNQQKQTELLISSLWKRFNFFLPTLVELLKLDKTTLSKDKLEELEYNIQKNTLLLSITYKDMQLLMDLFSDKYKVKHRVVSLKQMLDQISRAYNDGVYTTYCSFDWQFGLDDLTVEIDEPSVALVTEKIINNLIFRNHAQKISVHASLASKFLNLKFEMYYNENEEPSKIVNFNECHLCHLIASKLLQQIKGNLYASERSIVVSIPFSNVKNKELASINTGIEIRENQYSTYIWSHKTILYVTNDNLMEQWIYNALAATKVQLVPVACDAQFINYILKHPFADMVLIASSLLENNEVDYVGLIRRFLPDAKIVCFGEQLSNEKKCAGVDEFLTITDKFADDLLRTVSKFL